MRKLLLLFFVFSASLITRAQVNDYYAWGNIFDDLEVGYQFDVVTSDGNKVEGAQAVVVVDADNPENKVLHVTTGDTPGYVFMDTPGKVSSAKMKKYTILNVAIKSNVAYSKSDNCHFEMMWGNSFSYKDKDSNPSVFEAGVWKDCSYTPLSLERNNLKTDMKLGLYVANADYYIDDICFLATADAFERERIDREKARKDSILKADLAIRDSVIEVQEAAYAEMAPEIEKGIDQLIAYDFESFEEGTEFPVYTLSGKSPILGAKAVIVKVKNNKVLHITTTDTVGYVELDNPAKSGSTSILSAASLIKTAPDVSIKIQMRDNVSAGQPFDISWGGYYAHKKAPSNKLVNSKWIDNTFHLELEKNSLSKKMRIGIRSENADYYIDDIVFLMTSYDMSKSETTVRYWADKMGRRFGTCVNPGISTGDGFGKTVANNFNTVVLENAMKFDATEPNRNGFNWQADGVVSFAEQNNMKVRGHTLTWHGQNPSWVSNAINAKSGTARREEAINILKNHIFNVVGHWKGRIAEWDVVNECLNDGQSPSVGGGYSTRTGSIWYVGFGAEDYLDSAFVWAHQADPDAKLYLNDYSVGMWNKEGKTRAMYNLAKRLKDAGIPIDGVGFQTHTSVGYFDPSEVEISIQKFREIGLNVIITEMDMEGGQRNGDQLIRAISNEELATQAEKYARIAEIMLKYDNTPTFMVWGVRDNQSWLDCSESTKPLLFFADLSPHQAYIDIRKKYQIRASVLSGVESVFAQEEDDDPVWFRPEPKTVDVYDILGRKVAQGITMDNVNELPEGLYIIGGKKILIK